MKFSEMPYQRADIDAVIGKVRDMTGRLEAAATAEEAIDCLLTYNEMEKHLNTTLAISSIRSTQNTEDPFYEAEEQYYAERFPALSDAVTEFQKAMCGSKFRPELAKRFGDVVFVNAEIEMQTISKDILPLLAEENRLQIEHQKLQGSITVEFDGKTMSLPKITYYKASGDRAVRKAAFEAEGKAFIARKDEYDRLYDELVRVRTEIAKKLGFANFTKLGYLRMTRNSYDPQMVETFRNQVKRDLVPLVSQLKKEQGARIGVDKFMFYDDTVMVRGGNPKPIVRGDELYKAGLSMYREMSPLTRRNIDKMDAMGTFDLDSRKGKMTGGYCSGLADYQVPFIFANFNDTEGDVEVFTHEGGHAFADSLEYDLPDHLSLARPTLETCECHSMSMEFLCWPWLDRFYGEQSEKAKVIHLTKALFFIPYGCMVDEFQHIVYDHPELTPAQRNEEWAKLEKQYRPYADFGDLPFYSEGRAWQRQIHIYGSPFYYIDYCLAQTVSLQFMQLIQTQGWDKAWERYVELSRQSGTYPFTKLLERAGLQSPFVDGSLKGIVEVARAYIEEHKSVL